MLAFANYYFLYQELCLFVYRSVKKFRCAPLRFYTNETSLSVPSEVEIQYLHIYKTHKAATRSVESKEYKSCFSSNLLCCYYYAVCIPNLLNIKGPRQFIYRLWKAILLIDEKRREWVHWKVNYSFSPLFVLSDTETTSCYPAFVLDSPRSCSVVRRFESETCRWSCTRCLPNSLCFGWSTERLLLFTIWESPTDL